MAQTTSTLNANILGASLISNATSWRRSAHVGQSLIVVVGKVEGVALPRKTAFWGEELDAQADLSRIAGVFRNTLSNWIEVRDTYPAEDYEVFRGEMRGNVLTLLCH